MSRTRDGGWPVLKQYDGAHLSRISLPLGGIGTGTVSLGGRGQLCDWEMMNRPSKGFVPGSAFFALYAKSAGADAVVRALEGPLPEFMYEGASGSNAPNHGLPRFRNCRFDAAYPFGQVHLSDPEVPVDVRLEAFNPLVPGDVDASSIPAVVLRFVLHNRTGKRVDASVCGNLANFIGTDGAHGKACRNVNRFRDGRKGGWKGIFMDSEGVDPASEFYGTMSLSTDGETVSYRTAWPQYSWGNTLLDYWDDFSADGMLDARDGKGQDSPVASLAAKIQIGPHATKTVTFMLSWRFANRMTWHPREVSTCTPPPRALTPFVMTADVSEFLPADRKLARLEYPADMTALGFAPRQFKTEFMDLHKDIEGQGKSSRCVLYRTRISCREAMRLDLLLGADGPVRVWVDGQMCHHDGRGTNPAVKDEVRVGFDAAKGEHEVLVALGTNAGQAWGIFLRFERMDLEKVDSRMPILCGQEAPADACGCAESHTNRVGNYYATRYKDAWDVVRKTAPKLAELEARTLAFVRAFCESDLPEAVKEAALFNASTLRSQTCFRIESGAFFGWEGCGDKCGCCWGSCTHVWNYETATAFLFGDLARTMREVEYLHATDEQGRMSFRVQLPLSRARESGMAAADGQMGCLMKLYREWMLSGDAKLLKQLWPSARKSLEFCWIAGGWDGDQDGVMEGCQHNTMDVEYYGPNPQMQFWYLGALRAAEEMARAIGEADFADRCRALFEQGSAWMDAHLFNGQYYEHEIRVPREGDRVADGLQVGMGAAKNGEPVLQLGAGCLVDQLVGQYMAHVCGLGYLGNRTHIRKTLKSIMKYNWRENMYGHFNHMRSYALNDESALLMASYPLGRRPEQPFPYYNEVMTGFEYTAATHMLYEGQEKDGLKAIAAIRHRYDGARRNPFDEAECGHHYGRAMASWTGVLALTGFEYDGVGRRMTLAARTGRYFWSNGYAWGVYEIRGGQKGSPWKVKLEVGEGTLKLKSLQLAGVGSASVDKKALKGGTNLSITVQPV